MKRTQITFSITAAFLALQLLTGCGHKSAEETAQSQPQAASTTSLQSATAEVKGAVENTANAVVTNVAAAANSAVDTTLGIAPPPAPSNLKPEQVSVATNDIATNITAAASQAGNQATSLIDQAKSLLGNNKYTDATSILQKLASLALTPEQQSQVDSLKQQLQQGLTKQAGGDALKSAQDLLPK